MTETDFSSLPEWMCNAEYSDTLAELSATHPTDPSEKKYCLEPTSEKGRLTAVNFDRVKEHWYTGKIPLLCKSADALYVHSGRWYLIEFKTGKADVWATVRKIYDSVISLVENEVLTFSECREKLTFLLVMKEADRFRYYNLGKIVNKDYGKAWKYEVRDIPSQMENTDPRILTGQLVQKVFVLSVDDFCSFAHDWCDSAVEGNPQCGESNVL